MLPIDPYFPARVMRFGAVEGFSGQYLHCLTWPMPGASAHIVALFRASGSHLLLILFVFLETADTTSAGGAPQSWQSAPIMLSSSVSPESPVHPR